MSFFTPAALMLAALAGKAPTMSDQTNKPKDDKHRGAPDPANPKHTAPVRPPHGRGGPPRGEGRPPDQSGAVLK